MRHLLIHMLSTLDITTTPVLSQRPSALQTLFSLSKSRRIRQVQIDGLRYRGFGEENLTRIYTFATRNN